MENTIISDYEIFDKVGNGKFSVIYLGRSISTQKLVTLKYIDTKISNNEKFKDHFISNTKVLVNLKHPNIIKIENVINTPTNLILVMEYVDGISLDTFIFKNYNSDNPLRLLPFFYQLLDAIEYAHSQNIIHNNINSSNILIAKDGSLKLLGFDISEKKYIEKVPIETSIYMSPESLTSSRFINQQSDIYSLGVLLYYLLIGKTLSNSSDSVKQIKTKSLEKLSTINPKIPEVFDYILDKAIEKYPERRFLSAKDFKNHLTNKIKPTQYNDLSDNTLINATSTPPSQSNNDRVELENILKIEEDKERTQFFRSTNIKPVDSIKPVNVFSNHEISGRNIKQQLSNFDIIIFIIGLLVFIIGVLALLFYK